MKLRFTGQFRMNPHQLLQRAGYANARTKVPSFARRLGAGEYPRYHAYIDLYDHGFQINLHVDQKKASYGEHTAHSGEYDGQLVEQEASRLKQFIEGQRVLS